MLHAASGTTRRFAAGLATATVATLAAVGGPAGVAAADVSGITVTCKLDSGPGGLPMTVDVRGGLDGEPVHVGDSVDVTGFQVTLHPSQELRDAITDLVGSGTMVQASASLVTTLVNRTAAASEQVVHSPTMAFPDDQLSPIGADITLPASATSMGPFTPALPGSHNIDIDGVDFGFGIAVKSTAFVGHLGARCSLPTTLKQEVTLASFDVLPAPETSPPATSPAAGGPGGSGGSGGASGGSGGSGAPSAGGGTPTATAAGGSQPQGSALARTGVSHVVPMTGAGAALVLLGGGLVVAMRRRRRPAVAPAQPTDGGS